ncbi:MAG: hypothetical protein J0I06_09640 [Planctomycetes bacterium]|nr:hypothetical protein [Planctomycetota bacterium]
MRCLCAVLFVAGGAVGCEALRPAQPTAVPPPADTLHRPAAAAAAAPKPPAEVLRASAQQPVAPAAQVAPEDPLVLVAKCLERDDARGAAAHLETYVRAHPDQPLFRLQLAELYLRCGLPTEAKFHYEGFVADAEGVTTLAPHLVTGHIRLMETAQRSGDKFGDLYHRGAGLLLLVKTQDGANDRDAVFCEEMLCKALRALTDAKELKPNDPQARARLADALDRAGSRRAANAERAAARACVTGGGRKVLSE